MSIFPNKVTEIDNPDMVWVIRVYRPGEPIDEFYKKGTLDTIEGDLLKDRPEIEDRTLTYEIMPVGPVPPGCLVTSEGTVVSPLRKNDPA